MIESIDKAWRIWNGERCKVQFQWDPRDLWIGAFWRRSDLCLHIFVCFLPCVPLHVTLTTRKRIKKWQAKATKRAETRP